MIKDVFGVSVQVGIKPVSADAMNTYRFEIYGINSKDLISNLDCNPRDANQTACFRRQTTWLFACHKHVI